MKKNEEVPSENIEKKETIISQSFKKEINKDFQIMLTQLESLRQEAYVSLNSLNKNQIIELKSLVNPPELVNLAMQCICILLGVEAKKKLNEVISSFFLHKIL